MHFDHLVTAATLVVDFLDQGVDSDRLLAVLGQQVLYLEVFHQLVLCQAQDLKRLRSRHESPLDPESLLSHLFSAFVCVLLRVESIVFFPQIADNFRIPLFLRQRTTLLILNGLIIV